MHFPNPDRLQLQIINPAEECGLPLTQRPLVWLKRFPSWGINIFRGPLWDWREEVRHGARVTVTPQAAAGHQEGCGRRPSVLPGAEGMWAAVAGALAAAVGLTAVLPKLALGRDPQAGDSGSGLRGFNKPPR